MPTRQIRRSGRFVAEAKAMFPAGGSAGGRPSFALFEDGPCRAASTAFSLNFEAQREAIEGVGAIRLVLTPPTPIFGPLIFYGVLLNDDIIELASITGDPDYWQRIDEDPA
ncbi:MAG: hypothetical protein M3083_15165 [Actinomycetota bacterium]|nr:hypothetical protein [Actinomycetota bacterium]MDQ6949433.1 hypothetical protein [Actinomycetota bacterium]